MTDGVVRQHDAMIPMQEGGWGSACGVHSRRGQRVMPIAGADTVCPGLPYLHYRKAFVRIVS